MTLRPNKFQIEFDVNMGIVNYKPINFVTDDFGQCEMVLNLFEDGKPFNLEGMIPRLAVSIGTSTQQQEIEVIDCGVKIVLDNSIVMLSGDAQAEVQLYDAQDQTLRRTLPRFRFNLKSSIMNDGTVTSSDQFSQLAEMIENVKSADVVASEAVEQSKLAVENSTKATALAITAADSSRISSQHAQKTADTLEGVVEMAKASAEASKQSAIASRESADESERACQAAIKASEQAIQSSKVAEQSNIMSNETAVTVLEVHNKVMQDAGVIGQAKKDALSAQASAEQSSAILETKITEVDRINTKVNESSATVNQAMKDVQTAIQKSDDLVQKADDLTTTTTGAVKRAEQILESTTQLHATTSGLVVQAREESQKATVQAGKSKESAVASEASAVKAGQELAKVTAEGVKQVGLVGTKGNEQVTRVTGEGTKQVEGVRAEGSKQLTAVTSEGANQIQLATDQADRSRTEADRSAEVADTLHQDLQDARTDYQGKEHVDVSERLREDFGLVYNEISQMSLMDFESGMAKGTSKGLTRDMTVKGNTYHNLAKCNGGYVQHGKGNPVGDYVTITEISNPSMSPTVNVITYLEDMLLKPQTLYTCVVLENSGASGFTLRDNDNQTNLKSSSDNVFTFTTLNSISKRYLMYQNGFKVGDKVKFLKNFLILEGDWTNKEIPPYFEGIRSVGEDHNQVEVKSTGKNLVQTTKQHDVTKDGLSIKSNGNMIIVDGTAEKSNDVYFSDDEIYVKPNTKYTVSIKAHSGSVSIKLNANARLRRADGSYKYVSNSFTTDNEVALDGIRITPGAGVVFSNFAFTMQVEEASQATPYEPYVEDKKEVLLTAPLRSLPNGVRDEIVGNKCIRRVGKYLITGNEIMGVGTSLNGSDKYCTLNMKDNLPMSKAYNKNSQRCDKFIVDNPYDQMYGLDCLWGLYQGGDKIRCRVVNITQDAQSYQQYFRTNPTNVYYELETPVEEDLPRDMNVKTYHGVTHVTNTNAPIKADLTFKAPADIPIVLNHMKDDIKAHDLENKDQHDLMSAQGHVTESSVLELFEIVMGVMMVDGVTTSLENMARSSIGDLYLKHVLEGHRLFSEVHPSKQGEVAEKLILMNRCDLIDLPAFHPEHEGCTLDSNQ